MRPDNQFDTLIQNVTAGYPGPEGTRLLPKPVPARARERVQQPHPVLAFEAGLALFLVDAILALLLVWFLAHG